ncbi:MAG TPA: DUF3592 domain-containing protein [Cyclobacteriaceae bacterium]|nr:DUF3592 domain-containing protein [Cyclobacteriaceae bacterium]HRJ82444.1 DUF3592 domain-containing protein [Cyclobacteriaceae bacterium]
MSINLEIKQQVIAILQRGQRAEAKELLMEKFQVGPDDAEKLIQAIELEHPEAKSFPPNIAEQIALVKSQGGGCIVFGMRALMVFFLIFTFAFYAIAIGLLVYFNSYTGDAASITGTVVAFKENESGSQAPVVEYTWNNEVKRYESSMYASPPDYLLGEEVRLLVNPENPDVAIIDSFSERYMLSTMFAGFGTFFLVFSLGLLVVSRKIKRSLANSQ